MITRKLTMLVSLTIIIVSAIPNAESDIWKYHKNTNHADFVLANENETWVNPEGAELVRWDIESGEYEKYGAGDAGLSYDVRDIAYDYDGNLVVFDGENIMEYKAGTFNFVTTTPEGYTKFGYADSTYLLAHSLNGVVSFNGESWDEVVELSDYCVKVFWDDPRGGFWFRVYTYTSDDYLKFYDNGIQLEFTRFEITNSEKPSILVSHIFVDSKGIVWASLRGGTAWFDGEKWEQYFWDDIESQSYFEVYNSIEDNDGNIWFSASVNGLVKFDGETFTKIPEYEDTKVLWVDKAAEGGVWVGTEESLEYFDGTNRIPHIIPNQLPISNETTSVTIDPEGDIWCGDRYGDLAFLHRNDWSHFRGREITVSDNDNTGKLTDILVSNFHGLWAAFELDVFNYDGENWISFRSELEPEIGLGFYDLVEGPAGGIWIAVIGYEMGLVRWDGLSWEFHNFKNNIPQQNNVMCFDQHWNLWVITVSSLYSYDGIEWKEEMKFINEDLPVEEFYGNTITAMSDGSIWVGSKSRPCIIVLRDGEIIKTFTKEDGLPYTDDHVYNDGIITIKEAPDRTVWINSDHGLLHYDGVQFKQYTEYSKIDFVIDSSGRLFFPGSGITEFTPTSVTLKMNLFAPGLMYKAGDTFSLSLNVNNYGPDETGDLYFVMMAPDGSLYSGLDWSEGVIPAGKNIMIPEGFAMPMIEALKVKLPVNKPPIAMPGKYYFALALADTGTTYFRAKAVTSIDVVK